VGAEDTDSTGETVREVEISSISGGSVSSRIGLISPCGNTTSPLDNSTFREFSKCRNGFPLRFRIANITLLDSLISLKYRQGIIFQD
jgi:hypothetical protein